MNKMEKLYLIRRQNLRRLLEEFESQNHLASLIDTDQSYISQLINGHRGIGEDTARKIEAATGKPL